MPHAECSPRVFPKWAAVALALPVPGLGHFTVGHGRVGFAWFGCLLLFLPVADSLLVAPLSIWWGLAAGFLHTGLWVLMLAHTWLVARRSATQSALHWNSGRDWLRLAGTGLLGLVLLNGLSSLLERSVVENLRVQTHSMSPTLQGQSEASTSDRLVVDKLAYRYGEPRRGDVVVFRNDDIAVLPDSVRGALWVQRVVGLPGEQVSLHPPQVLINGVPVTDPPIFARITSKEAGYAGYVFPTGSSSARLSAATDTVQLGPEEYFLLGDNSASCLDSRYWGPLHRDAIVGRVTKNYWPLHRAGPVH